MLSVIIQGQEYSLTDGTYCRFIGADGLGAPDTHRLVTRGTGQHGVTDVDFRLDPRTFSLVLEIEGKTLLDYYNKRAELLKLLRPTVSGIPLRFKFHLSEPRYINAYFSGEGKLGYKDKLGFTQIAPFVFFAPEPWFDDGKNEFLNINLGGGSDGSEVPTDVPMGVGSADGNLQMMIPYRGSWQTTPLFQVEGPITNLTIINWSTGPETLSFHGTTIPSGETWIIDPSPGIQQVYDTNGNDHTDALTDLSDLATFHFGAHPEVPEGQNNFQCHGLNINDQTRITMTWKNYYIGI